MYCRVVIVHLMKMSLDCGIGTLTNTAVGCFCVLPFSLLFSSLLSKLRYLYIWFER